MWHTFLWFHDNIELRNLKFIDFERKVFTEKGTETLSQTILDKCFKFTKKF